MAGVIHRIHKPGGQGGRFHDIWAVLRVLGGQGERLHDLCAVLCVLGGQGERLYDLCTVLCVLEAKVRDLETSVLCCVNLVAEVSSDDIISLSV